MHIIPRPLHAMLDYLAGALLLISPYLFGFADGGAAQWVAQSAAFAVLLVSALSDYEMGLARFIPIEVNFALDMLLGVTLIASPLLFGFFDGDWWPHLLVGLASIVVPLLSERPTFRLTA